MIYSEKDKALVCTGYAGRNHKATLFKISRTTTKKGEPHESLYCPKCYRSYEYPESLKKSLERMNQVLEDEAVKEKGGEQNEQTDDSSTLVPRMQQPVDEEQNRVGITIPQEKKS